MIQIHFNFKQSVMIHTGLVKRSANRANEKQMYPEMTYAQAQKWKLKKKKIKQPKNCKHGRMNIPNLQNDSSI